MTCSRRNQIDETFKYRMLLLREVARRNLFNTILASGFFFFAHVAELIYYSESFIYFSYVYMFFFCFRYKQYIFAVQFVAMACLIFPCGSVWQLYLPRKIWTLQNASTSNPRYLPTPITAVCYYYFLVVAYVLLENIRLEIITTTTRVSIFHAQIWHPYAYF